MSNLHQAAEVIGEAYQEAMDSGTPSTWRYQIARALADAGLLAPDLPEANDLDISAPDEKLWLPCGLTGPSVWARPGGRIRVRRVEPGDLTPAEARFFALAVLAAAQYAKGEEHG